MKTWLLAVILLCASVSASAQSHFPGTLPTGCTNGQVPVYNTSTGVWDCGNGGGGGTPGGSFNSIQFNDAGSFGGFGSWDGSTLNFAGTLDIGNGTDGSLRFGYDNPTIETYGSATDIDLYVQPKGAGVSQFGGTGASFRRIAETLDAVVSIFDNGSALTSLLGITSDDDAPYAIFVSNVSAPAGSSFNIYHDNSGTSWIGSSSNGSDTVYISMFADSSGALTTIDSDVRITSKLSVGSNSLFIGDGAGPAVVVDSGDNLGLGLGALSTVDTDGGGGGTGFGNTALGRAALQNLTWGTANVAIGNVSGYGITTGSDNFLLGVDVGNGTFPLTTGSRNFFFGTRAGLGSSTQRSNSAAWGYETTVDADNRWVIGNGSVTEVYFGSESAAANVFGNIFQPTTGYKSVDGTAGATVTTCTGFKNGLCISGT